MSSGGKFILESLLQPTPQEADLVNLTQLQKAIDEICPERPVLMNIYSHCNYIKTYHKPVIPMAFEYNAIAAETGDLTYGNQSRFSLIQYGDYQVEMILEVNFGPLSVKNPLDRCGYVDFPMHRLMESVRLEMAGNKIDEYSYFANNVFYNYMVPEDKKNAWLDMVGQERPKEVLVQQSAGDNYREVKNIVNGLQTGKTYHNGVRLFIPIIFQFSRRTNTALFSSKIPYGQRYLYITCAAAENLFYCTDLGGGGQYNVPTISSQLWVNQLFIEPSIKKLLMAGTYRNFVRVYKEQKAYINTEGTVLLDQLRYPTEHIFYGARPFANTGPTTWWRFHQVTTETAVFPVCIPPNQLAFNTVNIINQTPVFIATNFLTKNTEISRSASEGVNSVVVPYQKGQSAKDIGLLLFSFARGLDSQTHDGYYNLNYMRDFYLNYTATMPAELYVLTVCLNWIDIAENGSVYIRFL